MMLMEHTKAGILCGCIEQMAADAEDKGKDSFGINLSLEDSRIITKTLFNADRYRWHDLRKNPEDLPKENGSYWICVEWSSGKKEDGECEFYVHDGYFYPCWDNFNDFSVIAWKCVEPFKEEN